MKCLLLNDELHLHVSILPDTGLVALGDPAEGPQVGAADNTERPQ